MHVHAALGLVAQRPQLFGLLAVEVQFRRVFQTQDHGVSRHALLRLLPVRFHQRAPVDAVVVVVEEAIRRYRLTSVPAGLRDARHRIGSKSFHHYSRSLVQARIVQVQLFKLRCCPVRRCGRQLVHPKDESKRENGQVYKGCRN